MGSWLWGGTLKGLVGFRAGPQTVHVPSILVKLTLVRRV